MCRPMRRDLQAAVAEVDLLGPSLRSRVLHAWNDTSRPIPEGVGIHHLVEQRADLTPDVTAVVFEDEVYDAQTHPLPREPHDRAVDIVATPSGWRRVRTPDGA